MSTIAFVFFVAVDSAHAQSDSLHSPVLQYELNGHVGRLVKIHGEYPENKISTLVEFNMSWKTRGRKNWQPLFRFPSAGFSLIHAQFGNQDVLGQAIAAIPTLRFERWHNNTRWSWRAGLGIAGFNKPFDAENNPGNLVIGSRFTNMSMFRVDLSRKLTTTLRYNIGFSLTHCSDAHIAVPNIGANLISLSAGISFCKRPNNISLFSPKIKAPRIHQKWIPGVQLILGMHEFPGTLRPADGPKYFVYGLSLGGSKRFNSKGKMSIALNYHYYAAYRDYMYAQELFPSGTNINKKAENFVLAIGYEWNYGRFAFMLQAGVNLYDPFLYALNQVWNLPKHGFLHEYTANKIGYKYYLTSHYNERLKLFTPYIVLAVKTNGGTADFLEFGFGLDIFPYKRKELQLNP